MRRVEQPGRRKPASHIAAQSTPNSRPHEHPRLRALRRQPLLAHALVGLGVVAGLRPRLQPAALSARAGRSRERSVPRSAVGYKKAARHPGGGGAASRGGTAALPLTQHALQRTPLIWGTSSLWKTPCREQLLTDEIGLDRWV